MLHPIRHFIRLCELIFPFANLRPSTQSYNLFRKNMNSFDGLSERVTISPIRRKRKRGPDQRQIDKCRHSSGGKIPQIACDHTDEGSSELCHANRLTEGDILMNFTQFHLLPIKPQQDEMLLRLMEVTKPRRMGVMEDARQRDKEMSVKY